MKITTKQLNKIIKEELRSVLDEAWTDWLKTKKQKEMEKFLKKDIPDLVEKAEVLAQKKLFSAALGKLKEAKDFANQLSDEDKTNTMETLKEKISVIKLKQKIYSPLLEIKQIYKKWIQDQASKDDAEKWPKALKVLQKWRHHETDWVRAFFKETADEADAMRGWEHPSEKDPHSGQPKTFYRWLRGDWG